MIAEGKITPVEEPLASGLDRAWRIQTECHASFAKLRTRLPHVVRDPQSRKMIFWLADAPQSLFDKVFCLDATGRAYLPVLQHAQVEDGASCAAITQGYSLWFLQQMLDNDKAFRNAMAFDISEVERVASYFPSRILKTLDSYRQRFDLSKLDVDPRDWPIVWLWDIADVLIPDQRELQRVLGTWNDDLFARMAYVSEMTVFEVGLKDRALKA